MAHDVSLPWAIDEAWLRFFPLNEFLHLLEDRFFELIHRATLQVCLVNDSVHLITEPILGVPNIILLDLVKHV